MPRPFAALLAVFLVTMTTVGEGHRPITSKYTYARDLLPLFRTQCGACHRPGGVAPMSLLTYEEARPWAQSIKEEVVSLRMPPRYAERGFGPIRNGHNLSARELDAIVDWAAGGTPEGPRAAPPPVATPSEHWRLGPPDLEVAMGEPFTLAADQMEATRSFAIPTDLKASRWLRAVDVRPGAPSIVRSVVAWIDTKGEARRLDATDPAPGFADEQFRAEREVLVVWTPGEDPLTFAPDVGVRLPPHADLVVRVHYKKTWRQEGEAVSDRTVLGLYFQPATPTRSIRTLSLAPRAATRTTDRPAPQNSGAAGDEVGTTLPADIDLLALVPKLERPLDTLRVEAVRPDGARVPLLLLSRPSPDWPARYWLERPLRLPRGTRVFAEAQGSGPFTVQLEYTAASRRR
jgi:mono/diheme cytochrome c family protein